MGVRQSSSTKRDKRVSPHTEELSDAELARRACLQSKEAWDILYLRYWDFLYDLASGKQKLPRFQRMKLPAELGRPRRLSTSESQTEGAEGRQELPAEALSGVGYGIQVQDITVEQLVNEVYIQVWEKRKLCSYEERAEFRWWYAVVVKNILEDLRRQQRRSGPSGQRVPLVWEDKE